MEIKISKVLLAQIHKHGEKAYPDEGAGFLLGNYDQDRSVTAILPISNAREDGARRNRYLITPEDYLDAELEADRRGLCLIGVFHSHPDSPERPSVYDRDWAQPFFSYIITSVYAARALESRSWRLRDDRSQFVEEDIETGERHG
ncbi:MAG: M67 family metallopeptidase [Anaerolineales bacterium]|nr:M67 family metallopeptidase [Anaerolineales bacterium]